MKKRFFIHYNKQASREAGRNVLTIHWKNACHPVNHFKSEGVGMESHQNKRQPRCVFRGFAKFIFFHNDPALGRVATITI